MYNIIFIFLVVKSYFALLILIYFVLIETANMSSIFNSKIIDYDNDLTKEFNIKFRFIRSS